MDGKTFDALVREAAADRSRRGVVKGIGGGLVAGVLVGLGLRSGAAQTVEPAACQDTRQLCNGRSECCGGGRLHCERISRRCEKNRLRRDQRCCSKGDTPCRDDCDCCAGYKCNATNKTCVEI